MKNNKTSFSTLDLCYIAIFTALIAVSAQISIPLPGGVPLTLQTFMIPLSGLVLGARRGTYATLVYVLLGAVGVPVFAGFTGGIGIVLGITGGFIISFPLMALFAGFADDKGPNSFSLWMWLVFGAAANYIVGVVWFIIIGHAGVSAALSACVIPFIPTAILKILLTGFLGPAFRSILLKANLLKTESGRDSVRHA